MYIVVAWDFIEHAIVKYNLVDLKMIDSTKMVVDENDFKTFTYRALIMGGFYIFLVIILSPLKNLSAVRYVLVPC